MFPSSADGIRSYSSELNPGKQSRAFRLPANKSAKRYWPGDERPGICDRGEPGIGRGTKARDLRWAVVKLSNGEYEVHNIGVNWPHHIFVNQDFEVLGAE